MDVPRRAITMRLISGDVRAGDLMNIFSYLRFRSFGNYLVQEVGNFVHHNDERDRGYASNLVEERASMWYFSRSFKPEEVSPERTPRTAIDLVFLTKRKADQRAGTLINSEYEKILIKKKKAFLDKFEPIGDGLLRLKGHMNKYEYDLMNNGVSLGDTDFTSSNLIDQFRDALDKNGLIEESEKQDFNNIEHKLSLFVASIIHDTNFISNNHGVITASIGSGAHSDAGKIVVKGFLKDESSFPGRTVGLVFPLFITKANIDEWAADIGKIPHFDFPIELAENFHLRRLNADGRHSGSAPA